MNSLDIFSVRALMRALEQIHSTTDATPLPERLFSALLALVPGAFFTLDELDLRTGQVTELTSVEGRIPDDIRKKILELIPTHPIMPVYKAGARGAIRITDCITQRQFRQTPHYIETLRPIDIRYQMIVTLDVPGKIAGMTVNRDKNFTEKEALILHLLAPHAALAHRNSQQFKALKTVANQLVHQV
jgi:GAF domain-containing protein